MSTSERLLPYWKYYCLLTVLSGNPVALLPTFHTIVVIVIIIIILIPILFGIHQVIVLQGIPPTTTTTTGRSSSSRTTITLLVMHGHGRGRIQRWLLLLLLQRLGFDLFQKAVLVDIAGRRLAVLLLLVVGRNTTTAAVVLLRRLLLMLRNGVKERHHTPGGHAAVHLFLFEFACHIVGASIVVFIIVVIIIRRMTLGFPQRASIGRAAHRQGKVQSEQMIAFLVETTFFECLLGLLLFLGGLFLQGCHGFGQDDTGGGCSS
mmetsp:Transcript_21962/g.47437  ORF Transcript_21962/g.47437 Transcript_21962/m.47437 type:complete len:262 (-) Transcript_21962:535-1320(-)